MMKDLIRNLIILISSVLLFSMVASAEEIAIIETKFGKMEIGFLQDKAPGMLKILKI